MTRRAACLVVVAALVLAACGDSKKPSVAPSSGGSSTTAASARPPVRIGTKNFTEEFILGELYKQALEAKGFPVVLKPNVGNSEITHRALTLGALDMYPEYVGTLLSAIAGERSPSDNAAVAYRDAKAFEERSGYTLLKPTPFEDRDGVAVTPAFARRHHLRTVADLRPIARHVRIAAPSEFQSRRQGLLGLQQVYHLTALRFAKRAIGAQYPALRNGEVQAAAIFTTDGQLAQHCCVVLTDPRGVFGTQHVAPIISLKIVKIYGKPLTDTLDAVSALLTTRAMQRMNAAVDIGHRTPRDVAAEFLRAHPLP